MPGVGEINSIGVIGGVAGIYFQAKGGKNGGKMVCGVEGINPVGTA